MPPSGRGSLRPVEFTNVRIDDAFWSERLVTLREVTIDGVYDHLVDSGRVENFRIAAGEVEGSFNPPRYNDSDVYKWLEGACYLLAQADDDTLRARVDDVVDAIAAAQEPGGYLNTHYQLEAPDLKWANLSQGHELYCAGHLFEAAVAHHRATGEDRLLDVARRLADHVDETFGPDARDGVPGHPEIELALAKLARETGEDRYLNLAAFFVERRGHTDRLEWETAHPEETGGRNTLLLDDDDEAYEDTYAQDHAPVRDQKRVEGHAVRAVYLFAGATDTAVATGDTELFDAMERLWRNMTTRRMYVTGGIGSAHAGERFTEDYDLPNESSYAETCAALGSILWNHRLLAATGESRFGDVVERTLYNAFLAGYGIDGETFFYENPHAVTDPADPPTRQDWFGTACCPTNVPRLLGSLGRYCYFRDDDASEVYVDQYVGSDATVSENITLHQETDYPWDGAVAVTVDVDEPTEFALNLRIPGWCRSFDLAVGGESFEPRIEDGYARLQRTWTGDESVDLTLSMPIERVAAHPDVAENLGRVALQRGPIVYCLEGVDHDRPLAQYAIDGETQVALQPDLLDRVAVLEGEATVPALADWDEHLYRFSDEVGAEPADFTALPYYAWGHREPGEMRIWLQSTRD